MEDEDDYESLPPSSSTFNHLLAGSVAGVLEHTIMYPVDCVKTRLQCLQPVKEARYSGLTDGLVRIMRTEGLVRSMRGIGAVVGGAGPAHALYFACYEHVKELLVQPQWGGFNQAAYAIAGCCATIFHDAIMTPADAVKQRVQMYNSPYSSSGECLSSLLRVEGPGVLYRAYLTQLTMNVPHQCVHFIVYEGSQDLINPGRSYRPATHMLCGLMAGASAALVSTPLDVCKTLLNTQDQCGLNSVLPPGVRKVNGLKMAASVIYQNYGLRGFMKGWQARVVFQMPGTAISWFVYESFKHFLRYNPTASS